MISDLKIRTEYSSDVRLWLEANGNRWPIAKTGPGYFVLAERIELAPCDAEIVMSLDGQERRWQVPLQQGICFFDSYVAVPL